MIGTDRKRSATYHLKSNGMIKRWHRAVKASIECYCDRENWSKILSTLLLGLRTCIRLDTQACPADLVFGTTLRIPGEFCLPGDLEPNRQIFLEELREYMKEVKPVPVARKFNFKPFVFEDMYTCSHVWSENQPAKLSLEPPYLGPYKVIERISDVDFKINVDGSDKVVNVERLKPAWYISDEVVDSVLGPMRPNTRACPIVPSNRQNQHVQESVEDSSSSHSNAEPETREGSESQTTPEANQPVTPSTSNANPCQQISRPILRTYSRVCAQNASKNGNVQSRPTVKKQVRFEHNYALAGK